MRALLSPKINSSPILSGLGVGRTHVLPVLVAKKVLYSAIKHFRAAHLVGHGWDAGKKARCLPCILLLLLLPVRAGKPMGEARGVVRAEWK